MPYKTIAELPVQFNKLPDGAKEIALNVINSALDRGATEESAFKQAWGAIKKSYRQDAEGNWVRIEQEEELETIDIDNVEILAVGKWNGVPATKEYKRKDLDELVKSFNGLSADEKLNYEPPIKLGHDDKQKLLQKDGYPAAGWVRSLKRTGDKLIASFGDVPKKIGEIIKAGGYKKVSSEIYHDYSMGEHKYPLVLKAVALLGGDIPAVKTIADIQAQYSEENGFDTVLYELREQVSLDELYTGLDDWLAKAEETIKGKVGSPAIRTFVQEVKARLKALLARQTSHSEDVNLDRKLRAIHDAFYKMIRPADALISPGWVCETYEDYIIMEKDTEFFKVPYSEKDGEVIFDMANSIKMRRVYEEVKTELEEELKTEGAWEDDLKEWDTKYINDLPDTAFAFIRTGGEKDEEGKTKPRALRFLPFKNAQGSVDLPHLRNALARLAQTSLTPAEQAKARKVLLAAAKKAGVGEHIESLEKEDVMEQELREMLKLKPEDDVLEAVKKIAEEAEAKKGTVSLAEHKETEGKVTSLQERLDLRERDERVSQAIRSGKITPAQKEWAESYALADPQGFDSFIEKQPVVVKLSEVGGDGKPDVGALSEQEVEIAKAVGNTPEELLEDKKEQSENPEVS